MAKHEVAKTAAAEMASLNRDRELYGLQEGQRAPGTENIGERDMLVPRLRLIQPTSAEAQAPKDERIEAGCVIHNATGEIVYNMESSESFEIVPLMLLKGRAMFNDRNQLMYKSRDGILHGGQPRPDGITLCADCPDAMWTGMNNNIPPKCGEQSTYPCIVVGKEHLGPAMLILHRTNIPISKLLNTPVYWSALPYYAFSFKMRTELVKGEKGNFYVLKSLGHKRVDAQSETGAFAALVFEKMYAMYNQGKNIVTDAEDDEPVTGVHYENVPDEGTDAPF